MLNRLIIITILDLVLIWPLVYSEHPDPSESQGVIIIVPILILINVIAGLILRAFKNNWSIPILINGIISSAIFYYTFSYEINKGITDNYKSYFFENGKKNYEISFKVTNEKFRDSLTFEFYELGKGSTSTINVSGRYHIRKDTLLLRTDSGTLIKIYKPFLFDFTKKGDTIKIRDR